MRREDAAPAHEFDPGIDDPLQDPASSLLRVCPSVGLYRINQVCDM